MKLECVQEKLNRGLILTGRLIGLKTTLPVLNNILLVAAAMNERVTNGSK